MEKMSNIWKASIRQGAIYLPEEWLQDKSEALRPPTRTLVANAAKLGFSFSEPLLRAVNRLPQSGQVTLLELFKELATVDGNWTPLVKDWEKPQNDSWVNSLITMIANAIRREEAVKEGNGQKDEEPLAGAVLPCGHLIPEGTFPLERYNGCPFCGTPFVQGELELKGQGTKLKVLELWQDQELEQHFQHLIASKTPLDATQGDSLKRLLRHLPTPDASSVGIKETSMLIISVLVEEGRGEEAQPFFQNPNDVLRYLWYEHTGFLQLVEPKTILQRQRLMQRHPLSGPGKEAVKVLRTKEDLKLRYSRKECRMAAHWLNNIELPAEKACEIMHPKRRMWARFIRALRLSEYSKKPGFSRLAELMDVFYNKRYTVLEGRVQHFRLKSDAENTFALLKQRPGLFARSLFANMLWFGPEVTLEHFYAVADQVPRRLLLSLAMYAPDYFDPSVKRSVATLGGGKRKTVLGHPFLKYYSEEELRNMAQEVVPLALAQCKASFEKEDNQASTMYIDPELENRPLPIGDRSTAIQDYASLLSGTRLPVEGDKVRLFIQWGIGLSARHLDMDLSCKVVYEHKKDDSFCSYSQLDIPGCIHSGDYQYIPDEVGAAEYIEVDLPTLQERQAKYVAFTANAYSRGGLAPNMIFGWMDSKYNMEVSRDTGVSYDPSCVQQQIRIDRGSSKGLLLGMLDVEAREVIWMELRYDGQVVQGLKREAVEAMLAKLQAKLSVADLLHVKAEAQGLSLVDDPEEADEVYTQEWAKDAAGVSQLL